MNEKTVGKVISNIPEAYYDGLTYVVQGGYILIALALITIDYNYLYKIGYFFSSMENAQVRDLFLVFLFLAISYFAGQILTSLSYLLIAEPMGLIFFKKENKDWLEDCIRIKVHLPPVSLIATKRYARWVFSRNMALASFLIFIIGLICLHKPGIIVHSILLPISLLDAGIRKKWLNEFLANVFKVASKPFKKK